MKEPSIFYKILHDYACLVLGTEEDEKGEENPLPKETVYIIAFATLFVVVMLVLVSV